MKILKTILLLASIQLFFYGVAYSQKLDTGYVITTKNDTIKCLFQFHSQVGHSKYRPLNSKGKFIIIDPDQVKEYGAHGHEYQAFTINFMGPQYLLRIEKGSINLYQQESFVNTPTSYTDNMFWYITKDNGPIMELKSTIFFNKGSRKKRRQHFDNLISDDVELAEKFKNEQSFDINTLRSYIVAYNLYKSIDKIIPSK